MNAEKGLSKPSMYHCDFVLSYFLEHPDIIARNLKTGLKVVLQDSIERKEEQTTFKNWLLGFLKDEAIANQYSKILVEKGYRTIKRLKEAPPGEESFKRLIVR